MPISSPFLSIIFPAHNEEERLPETLQYVDDFVTSHQFSCEVIIVENASVDRTFTIAQEFASNHPYIRVIHLEQPGKGRAVQTGMLTALGEYRFICDVDLSMPITEIPSFLPPQQMDTDIVIASREAPGAVRYDEPVYRHLIGRMFNNLVRWIVLPHLQDTQCGFKCFTAAAAQALFTQQTIMGWTFDVEVLAIAYHYGYRIKEIPIQWYYQPRSKVNVWSDSVKMARDLLLIRRKIRRGDYDRQT